MSYLTSINSPSDLKKLTPSELKMYANEIREYIINTVMTNGGHLSSNLGVVDLTIALHFCFDCPIDKIIWDVGHQSYAHKIITGRRAQFENLRRDGGITGFPNTSESECDLFTTGHASTSLSLALGLARAQQLTNQKDGHIIPVIGDGALTGGLAFEALNDIGEAGLPMIIVLNDNEMSISKNVGALSQYLAKLRVSRKYVKFKTNIKNSFYALPLVGDKLIKRLDNAKDILRKFILLEGKLFESMGIKYYGPFEGNDINQLIPVFNRIKTEKRPVIVHVVTSKGAGLESAVHDPAHSHGVADACACEEKKNSAVFSDFLFSATDSDKSVVVITAAMPIGLGIEKFAAQRKENFIDVGICEEHAVSMCAGLAKGGAKPYLALYSTFLQRGYDQIIHDVCLNNLPVRFIIDRAGVIGSDGITHQGVFDLSYLSHIPNLTVLSPKDGAELRAMLDWSLSFNQPLAIRYHKDFTNEYGVGAPIEYGKFEKLRMNKKSKVYFLAVGSRMVDIAMNVEGVNVINARFVKPLDTEFLDSINKEGNVIITLEDNLKRGGFGEAIAGYFCNPKAKLKILAHDDKFIESLSVEKALFNSGLTCENLQSIVKSLE